MPVDITPTSEQIEVAVTVIMQLPCGKISAQLQCAAEKVLLAALTATT